MFIRHVFDRLHHYMAFVIIYGTETSYVCFNVLLYVYEGFSGLFYLYMGITESTRYVWMCACVCLTKSSCDTFKGTSQPKPEWCSSNGGLCDLQTHVFLMTAGSTAHLKLQNSNLLQISRQNEQIRIKLQDKTPQRIASVLFMVCIHTWLRFDLSSFLTRPHLC